LKKIIYIFTLFILTSTLCPATPKEQVVRYESSTLVPERSFNKEKLEKTKANQDFNYNLEQKKEEPSWLDKILYRIARFLINILFNPTGSAESIFFYIICGLLVLALIFVILRMTAVGIFSRGNKQDKDSLEFSELIEDINSIDFDKMIEEAVNKGMYRRAVRLYYLKSLKHLSDRSQIVWEINKTNRDYFYELRSHSLRPGFEDITYVYEYVWYGNMEIDAEKFSKVKVTFHSFHNQTVAAK
jgi:hypothetical protein